MASAEIELKVALEAVIHQGLREALEKIAADYGLRVTAASATWVEVSTFEKPAFCVGLLGVTMESS